MNSATLSPTEADSREGKFLSSFGTHEELDSLLDAAWRNRFSTFFALLGELLQLSPEDCDASGFLSAASDLLGLEEAERRTLVSHPIFRIWTGLALLDVNARLTGSTDDLQAVRKRLDGFSGMLERVRLALRTPFRPEFYRLDVDPLIASVLPPSYQIPNDPDERETGSRLGHPLSFFQDVVFIALNRIQETWPEAREHFDRLVYILCYLPDATFRSCSASRYTGVILISSRDRSVLDLEESLVHEAGHQLLYSIIEVQPVTDSDTEAQFRLPWSGQSRNLYGYFHAFFIYVLLAQYHERAMDRPGGDGIMAAARLRHILGGLITALPDFQGNPHLTAQGRALIDVLASKVAELEERHRSLLATQHV